jgi:hypothetical protein
MRLRLLSGIVSLLLVLPATARAQDTVIAGAVTDATGAVLPGVAVVAVHVESGNTFAAVTNPSGEYRIGALRPGTYTLTAELAGFSTVRRENLQVLLGERVAVNFSLVLSTVQETVTVTGASPLIDITESKLGGNVDARQMQELPVNGRNWIDLTMLSPGSRANAITESPLGTNAGTTGFQLNMDGQRVTNMVTAAGYGQPRFSRDAISEFEFITNRFDATQGGSMAVVVNAVTKSGTNQYSGSVSGYFRDDSMIAKDFIVGRVLPYEDQQVAATFGGPIRKDRIHVFGNYEYEREPQTFTYTSPYPRFNIESAATRIEHKGGAKLDTQFSSSTRLMLRGFSYWTDLPYDPRYSGGATQHPSAAAWVKRSSDQLYATVTQVLSSTVLNQVKVGYNSFTFSTGGVVPGAPQIVLRGYQIGKNPVIPHSVVENRYELRDDLTFVLSGYGRHELKLGGEAMYNQSTIRWFHVGDGIINATGGPPPANLQDLFPVWNDMSTWNLAALSPITLWYRQSFGGNYFIDPKRIGGAWAQDNWAITNRLTLNLGLRYDVSLGSLAEYLTLPPFLPELRPSDTLNFQPRLGAAYGLPDGKTVIRGGWGKYFGEMTDNPNHVTQISSLRAVPEVPNDGRPNFAADPFNGRPPTFDEIVASGVRRDLVVGVASPDFHTSYSYQASLGVQRQLGDNMAVEADYAYTGTHRDQNTRNQNLTYDPVTGVNYPFTDISKRPFPNWGYAPTYYTDGWSNYHALQTAFAKRFSKRWQGAATYTLSFLRDASGAPTGPCFVSGTIGPCPAGFQVAPDLGGEYTLAVNDQRHRAVFNGIWQLPYRFQLSGLYFYGSGQRFATSYGADLRATGATSGRLRPNGSIVPRNNLVGDPLHRVDMRVLYQLPLYRARKLDAMLEVFNLFNHANYGAYVTSESSTRYGQPQQNTNVAYQPRMLQLGFRLTF